MDRRIPHLYNDSNKSSKYQISLENIVDAEIHRDKIYFITSSGELLEVKMTPETRELYWEIKLRNRRKAFGL